MNRYLWICLCVATAFAVAAEESATVNRNHVNVRGAPTINSEVVTRLQKGDKVTFLEEIAVEKPKTNEPARWAAIKLPADAHAWVFVPFLEGNKVKVNRLNLRGGPGENYSILGRLEKGAEVKEIRRQDEWMEIETPENTRAYVDATYIDRASVAPAPPVVVVETPKDVLAQKPIVYQPPKEEKTPEPAKPAETKPVETKPVESKPVETAVVKEEPAPVPAKEETVVAPTPPAAKPEETPTPAPIATEPAPARVLPPVAPVLAPNTTIPSDQKRIVRREGEVRSTKFNIQAPTYFELIGERGKILNYLTAEKTGFKLKDYKGLRVIVTGEEAIDPRYPDRPLIEVETIEVAP